MADEAVYRLAEEYERGETRMTVRNHNPKELYPQYPGYAHAVEVSGGARTLYISGLNGYEADGKTMPESFEAQSELIWKHMKANLAAAGMTVNDLVFLRTYLARPEYMEENKRIRVRHLGDRQVGITVVAATLLKPEWKLEVEAVAAA
jgi:enamine deaminase RidA (YjgF/YER057c/UK114 family)